MIFLKQKNLLFSIKTNRIKKKNILRFNRHSIFGVVIKKLNKKYIFFVKIEKFFCLKKIIKNPKRKATCNSNKMRYRS